MSKLLFVVIVLFASVPAYADAPPTSQPQISMERRCYYAVEQEWNNAISMNESVSRFNQIYGHFAKCASVAVDAKAWPEYFADTMGAMYAQIQMAGLTKGKDKCGHYAIAKDLGEQAEQIEQSTNEQGDPDFEGGIGDLLKALGNGALDCGSLKA